VHCPTVLAFLRHLGRPLARAHLVDASDLVFLAEPTVGYTATARDAAPLPSVVARLAWDGTHDAPPFRMALLDPHRWERVPASTVPTSVDGLACYFTADLYGGVLIDTRHTSPGRTAFHWEAFLLPLAPEAACPPGSPRLPWAAGHRAVATIERHCLSVPDNPAVAMLWYTWAVDDGDGPRRCWNTDGRSQLFLL
jgi:hypothetical protein